MVLTKKQLAKINANKKGFHFKTYKEYSKMNKDEAVNYNIQQLDARGINNDFKGRELDSYLFGSKGDMGKKNHPLTHLFNAKGKPVY